MDLREVLAEAFDQVDCPHRREYNLPFDCQACLAAAASARLSQPDVLDEFERRCEADPYNREDYWTAARKVLADMLGGES